MRTLLLMLILALASACAGSPARDPTTPAAREPSSARQSATTTPASGSRLNGIELNRLDPATLDQLLKDASDYQRVLLADGDLTLEEYERAMLDTIACLRERGFHVSDEEARLNGVYLYLPTYSHPSWNRPEIEAASRDCESEYASIIKMAWSIVLPQVLDDAAQRSRAYMLNCLNRKGVALEQRPWSSTDPDVTAVYHACISETQATFDLGYIFFGVEGQEQYME